MASVDTLLDQGRYHVRLCWIEVVPRAIQVHRQQENGPESVLLPVSLALYEEHLLGEPIGRIGLLWVPVPEVVLPEGNRRQLRIGAHGPDGNEFLDTALAGYLHELCTHHQIVVEEFARSFPIGSNSSHHCSEVQDDVRAHLRDQAFYGICASEVVLGLTRGEYLGAATFVQVRS